MNDNLESGIIHIGHVLVDKCNKVVTTSLVDFDLSTVEMNSRANLYDTTYPENAPHRVVRLLIDKGDYVE